MTVRQKDRNEDASPALKALAEVYRDVDSNDLAAWFEVLTGKSDDAVIIREWFKKNARADSVGLMPVVVMDSENWEIEIYNLVHFCFDRFTPASSREKTAKGKRDEKAEAIINKARTLATALEDDAGPECPPVLALFDPERAVDILRDLPAGASRILLEGCGYSAGERDCYGLRDRPSEYQRTSAEAKKDPAESLARFFGAWKSLPGEGPPAQQLFPSLLRRLADHIEAGGADIEPPLPRPGAEDSDARIFARMLARHLEQFGGKRPHRLIAACIRVRFPDMKPSPDRDSVKEWLRHVP